MFPAILGAVAGLGSGIASFFGNRETNQTNAQLTREQNEQNERLMREQWQREDSAYTRAAADLQKAGLSKTLAAGHPASAGSVVPMQKAEYTSPVQKSIDTAYRLMSMVQDFEKRQNENAYIGAMAKKAGVQAEGETIRNLIANYTYDNILPIDKDIKLSIYKNNSAALATAMYNLAMFGNSAGSSPAVRPLFDISNALSGFGNELANGAKSILEKVGRNFGKDWNFSRSYHNPAEQIFYDSLKNLNL